MNQAAYKSIAGMLNAFPLGSGDPDVLLATFEKACAGFDTNIIQEVAARYTDGRVKGQRTDFAPTVAQFATECRIVAELWQYKNRPALPAPAHYSSTPPFMVRGEQAKTKFAGWSVFKEDVSYDEARNLSKAGELPVGATWSGCLATIFLPPVKE